MADDESLKLSQQLVMTPQLQMAIRMLSMTQDELFAMVDDWRSNHPGALADLEPGDPEPANEEEQELYEQQGTPIWSALTEPPLPDARPRPDVWVFGNPPQARANAAASPRVKAVFDDAAMSRSAADVREAAWLARALRQRLKTMERVVAQLLEMQPLLAISVEPDTLTAVDAREVGQAIGFHESTIQRVASACRYQTIHGVVQLVTAKRLIRHRALW